MLPILYTRQFLMDQWKSKQTQRTDAMIYSTADTLFAADRGPSHEIPVTRGILALGGLVEYRCAAQQIMIGLLETSSLGVASHSPGIAIAIDLRTGLVTDLVNDQGVLGYLEYSTLTGSKTLQFRLELDLIGRVCVPRLLVNDDIILHPSLYLDARKELTGVTGTSLHPRGDAKFSGIDLEFTTQTPDVVLSPG